MPSVSKICFNKIKLISMFMYRGNGGVYLVYRRPFIETLRSSVETIDEYFIMQYKGEDLPHRLYLISYSTFHVLRLAVTEYNA